MFGVAENIKTLLVNSVEKWKVMLCAGNSELREAYIKQGFFQGDSLSPMVLVLALILLSLMLRKTKAIYEFSGNKEKINHPLFMDDLKLYSDNEKELASLVQAIHIFSKDIGMKFGKKKCAILVIEKGKTVKSLQEGESYKYPGILATERFLGAEMKPKVYIYIYVLYICVYIYHMYK